MSILTPAAFLSLAVTCAPDLDPRLLLVQAQGESGLKTDAINYKNRDGSTDYGLMQINSKNFGVLHIQSPEEVLSPCRNLRAADDLYLIISRWNPGDPHYAAGVMNRLVKFVQSEPRDTTAAVDETDPKPPAWDMEAVADWNRRHNPTAEDAADAPPEEPPAVAEPIAHKEVK